METPTLIIFTWPVIMVVVAPMLYVPLALLYLLRVVLMYYAQHANTRVVIVHKILIVVKSTKAPTIQVAHLIHMVAIIVGYVMILANPVSTILSVALKNVTPRKFVRLSFPADKIFTVVVHCMIVVRARAVASLMTLMFAAELKVPLVIQVLLIVVGIWYASLIIAVPTHFASPAELKVPLVIQVILIVAGVWTAS